MTTDEREICWLAGLLEGEGCFSPKKKKNSVSAMIQINMNDKDVLDRVSKLVGHGNVNGPYFAGVDGRKGWYAWIIYGELAMEVMRAIRPLMCKRRAAKIDEVLDLCS